MSSRCTLCGELSSAGAEHVCPDDLTAGLDQDQPAPSPPGSEVDLAADASDPLIGTTLADRYALLSRVSQGGMGVVYRARHTLLNNIVAVKVLLKQEDDIDQRRFLQEAQLASKIAHPNIVYIADYGLLPDGRPYLVMEYIEGPTLGRVLRRAKGNRIDTLRACKLALQLARGMQVVHDKGIVHRDRSHKRRFGLHRGARPLHRRRPDHVDRHRRHRSLGYRAPSSGCGVL